jgi:cell division protein FtsL
MNLHGHTIQWSMLVTFIPVLATIVTTFLSIVLARATLRYAHAADRTLELAHEQFEREWAPELHLRLERSSSTDARMIITNLAKTSVLLQLVQLCNVSGTFPLEKQYLNDPLVGGTAWNGQIGEHLLRLTGHNFSGPIAASASFYAAGRLFRTDWFRFKVEVHNGRIDRIDAVTLPARRVRVLVPHKVRRFRKPLVSDVAKEVVETTKMHD